MVVKPLLVERLVAVLVLDPWSGGMMLAQVVGQVRLSQSLKRAARVVTVQSILYGDETLFPMSLLLIFSALLFVFCLLVEKLYSVFDGGAPGTALLGLLPPGL